MSTSDASGAALERTYAELPSELPYAPSTASAVGLRRCAETAALSSGRHPACLGVALRSACRAMERDSGSFPQVTQRVLGGTNGSRAGTTTVAKHCSNRRQSAVRQSVYFSKRNGTLTD